MSKRRKLNDRRPGYTQQAWINGHEIILRTGEFEDGTLAEIFIDMYKEGTSTFRSLLNAFAIVTSQALQHGVPLERMVKALTDTNYPPNGRVDGTDQVAEATSIIDYVFRELGTTYLKRDDLHKPKDSEEMK